MGPDLQDGKTRSVRKQMAFIQQRMGTIQKQISNIKKTPHSQQKYSLPTPGHHTLNKTQESARYETAGEYGPVSIHDSIESGNR